MVVWCVWWFAMMVGGYWAPTSVAGVGKPETGAADAYDALGS